MTVSINKDKEKAGSKEMALITVCHNIYSWVPLSEQHILNWKGELSEGTFQCFLCNNKNHPNQFPAVQVFMHCVKMGKCVKNRNGENIYSAFVVCSTAISFLQYNYQMHSKHTVQGK